MALNELHAGAAHHAHDENIDHQGNANLAVWLSLASTTFITATFVGANVYLRGWSPTKFDTLNVPLLKDLPYYDVLLQIVAALLLFGAGALFVKNRWRAFNLLLGLSAATFIAVFIIQFRLTVWFANASPQIATIYAPSSTIEFLTTGVCVVLVGIAGWYASFGSKKKINYYFPVFMNVWLYSVCAGIVILLLEDVMSIGRFAAWCGQHLT